MFCKVIVSGHYRALVERITYMCFIRSKDQLSRIVEVKHLRHISLLPAANANITEKDIAEHKCL
jgi:hypothetical protein